MGGRGAVSSSGRSSASALIDEGSVHLESTRSWSSGGQWKHTVLKAEDDGSGNLTLEYAIHGNSTQLNRNTTRRDYEIRHGVWSGQAGNRSPGSIGIDWDKVKSVSGRTYDVQSLLKGKGLRWDRGAKKYVR